MVQYVTRSRLAEIGREELSISLAKVAKAERRNPQSSTFLSHSSKDDDAIPGVVLILENHGAQVYVDKKDASLQSTPPQEIASSLRSKIRVCRKFVVFATNNTKDSKWVPWELGLADGYRYQDNVCVFPGPDKLEDRQWMEQEYLGIYHRIVWGAFHGGNNQWLVWNHKSNEAVALEKWLSK